MGTSPAGEFCGAEIIGIPLLNGPAEFTDFYPVPVQFTSAPKRLSKPGDILFCVRGSTTGRMNWSDQEYAIGRGLAAISHKSGSEYNHFLRYLLENNLNSLLNNTNGSTFPNLTRDLLAGFIFTIPALGGQKKISALFKSVDTKIELNNRINAELEAMAKTLYDYWFVQFDFPDTNGKPYKTSGGKMVYSPILKRKIPEGWSDCLLGNYITFKRGISYKSGDIQEDGVPFINLNSFSLGGEFKLEGTKYYNGKFKPESKLSAGDLVIAITDVTRNADIIGKAFVIPNIFDETPLISCDVACVSSKYFGSAYLEQLFNSENYHKYIKHYASGTLVLHLDLNGMKWFKTYQPPKELLEKYNQHCNSLFKQRDIALKENMYLEALRNWLLPMLMNGQVTVK